MASIGKLALQISANAAQFVFGLEYAGNAVKKFTRLAEAPIKFAGGQIGAIGDAFSGLFKFAINPLAPIESAFESFFALVGEGSQLKKIAEIGRTAVRVGVDASDFIVFMKGSRLEADMLAKVLTRTTNAIHKQGAAAEQGATPLESLGLNLKKLKDLDTASMIEELSRQYQGLTEAQKRQVDVALGGMRQAGEFQRLMRLGAAGLAELKERLGKQGVLFTSEDALRGQAAIEAVRTLRQSFEGIKTQLALSFAPLITEIAEGISSWIDRMGGGRAIAQEIANTFVNIAIAIVEAAQAIANAAIIAGAAIRNTGSVLQFVKSIFSGDVIGAAKGVIGISAKTGFVDFSEAIDRIRKAKAGIAGLGKGGKGPAAPWWDVFGRVRESAEAAKRAADFEQELGAGAEALADALGQEASMFGISGNAAKIYELRLKGLRGEKLDNLLLLQQELLGMEEEKKKFEDLASLFDATRTPAEQFGQEIERLADLFADGKGDVDLWARGISAAVEKLDSATKGNLTAGPAALMQGTSAAISAVNAAQREVGRDNPFKRAEEILTDSRRIQGETRDELKRWGMEAGLGNLVPP